MSIAELRVELPDTLSVEEARTLLAVKLYEVGKITLGQAAQRHTEALSFERLSKRWRRYD